MAFEGSDRPSFGPGDYCVVDVDGQPWPAVVCTDDMIPKETFQDVRLLPNAYNMPVLLMVKLEFRFVQPNELRRFNPGEGLSQVLEAGTAGDIVTAYLVVTDNGYPDLGYWQSVLLARRLQENDADSGDEDTRTRVKRKGSVHDTSVHGKRKERLSSESEDEFLQSPGLRAAAPIIHSTEPKRKRKKPGYIPDEDDCFSFADCPEPARRRRKITSIPHFRDAEDDDEDTILETPEPPQVEESEQSYDDDNLSVSGNPSSNRSTSVKAEGYDDGEGADDDGLPNIPNPGPKNVTILIGKPAVPFVFPRKQIAENQYLKECMYEDDKRGWIIAGPSFDDFNATDFQPVAEYLNAREYTPRLLHSGLSAAQLLGVRSAAERSIELERCGKIFYIARQLGLVKLMSLAVRKFRAIRNKPVLEFLMVLRMFLKEEFTGLGPEEELRDALVAHVAENFWEMAKTELNNLHLFVFSDAKDADFASKVLVRMATSCKSKLSTPASGGSGADSGLGVNDTS